MAGTARAKKGAPNVIFIVQDDTGFGQLGCYGGPIKTPNLDSLAANGLLFNNMHTTALCSPTRSCILTGRNHHSNAMSCITEGSTGYPGGNGNIPFENGFLSEILVDNGYSTFAIGKWHLTPADQISAAGPYNRWPLGRGFERYYGFLGGDTHQYYPELVYDNHSVEPEKTPEEGYHLTEDLVDKAIAFIADTKQVAPDKPFFLYLAPGCAHAPHHVPKEWADQYKGQFDDGWDALREKTFKRQKELGIVPKDAELSRHDPDVQDWQKLSADERKLYARMMEVFAGFVTHADHHYGRLFSFLKSIDAFENTLIMFISDNGASAEGGPTGSVNENKFFNNVPDSLEENLKKIDELGGPSTFNHYAWGWTHAGNTPFKRWKRETYRGGVSDPFLVHWPKGIKSKGQVRTQYAHAIDMMPTVLEALGLEAPTSIKGVTQSPIEGHSFAHAFDDAKAPSKHITQYFEMFGHRSIYHDGWRAVCPWPGTSFVESGLGFGAPIDYAKLTELDAKGWELYNLEKDFAETNNLAEKERAKLIEMIGTWYVEAGKYNVLPIDSRGTARLVEERPQLTVARTELHVLSRNPDGARQLRSGGVESPALDHGGRRDPERRRRRVSAVSRRRPGWLRLLHAGRQAALRLQLRRERVLPRRVERQGSGRPPQAPLRVRGHRQTRHRQGQGRAGEGSALCRRQAGWGGRCAGDDAALDRSCGRHGLRRRHRFAGVGQVQAAIQVHRHDPQRDRGRQRRTDQGSRGRGQDGDGSAVRN